MLSRKRDRTFKKNKSKDKASNSYTHCNRKDTEIKILRGLEYNATGPKGLKIFKN